MDANLNKLLIEVLKQRLVASIYLFEPSSLRSWVIRIISQPFCPRSFVQVIWLRGHTLNLFFLKPY